MIHTNEDLLIEAARDGNLTELQRLTPLITDQSKKTLALQWAAEEGQYRCVQFLIPFTQPKDRNSWALTRASHNGHAECVKLLIPVSDAKAGESYALQRAMMQGYRNCVDLLFPISDAQVALQQLQEKIPNRPAIWKYLEYKICEQQKQLLFTEIGSSGKSHGMRKM